MGENKKNYIENKFRVPVFVFSSITLASIFASMIWIFVCRDNHIVKASQPLFLYILLMGCAMVASVPFFQGMDEKSGWSKDSLSYACDARLWFECLGPILAYCALFTKLWRVNKVLQFRKRKISMKAVAAPAALCVLSAIILLANSSTNNGGLFWERKLINGNTGESRGMCHHDEDGVLDVFRIIILLLGLVPVVLTGLLAWKTRDVDSLYSESYYIFWLIAVQIEVALLFTPILYTLKADPNGLFISVAILCWFFAESTVTIIMLPKFLRVHWPRIMEPVRQTRGAGNGVVVTGMPNNQASKKNSTLVSHASSKATSSLSNKISCIHSSKRALPEEKNYDIENIQIGNDV